MTSNKKWLWAAGIAAGLLLWSRINGRQLSSNAISPQDNSLTQFGFSAESKGNFLEKSILSLPRNQSSPVNSGLQNPQGNALQNFQFVKYV